MTVRLIMSGALVGQELAAEFGPLPPAFLPDGVGGLSLPVRAVTVSLFLSMLPLHADRPDRQRAFVANALRLWRDLDA